MDLRNILISVALVFSSLIPVISGTAALTYDLSENQPAGTKIGDVFNDSDLKYFIPPAVQRELRYKILLPERFSNLNINQYILINETNGIIFSRSIIDREEICSRK